MQKLGRFAAAMEEACVQAVEAGQMTKVRSICFFAKVKFVYPSFKFPRQDTAFFHKRTSSTEVTSSPPS